MTLTELRYIVALANEGHFGRAAEKCHVAQPTLSVAVKKLEAELGVILFERGPAEVSVTSAGLAVIEQAQRVLTEVLHLSELARAHSDPLAGPLRFGAIHTIGPYLLPRLVPIIKNFAPQMPLIIEEGLTERLLTALKNGLIDVAVLALPVQEPSIVTQPLYHEVFRVLIPITHPWVQKKEIKIDDLHRATLLMLGRGNCFRDQVLDLCAPAGENGPQVLEGSSLETIRYMVASGIGITVMPASAVDEIARHDPLLCIKPFAEPQPMRQVALAWRSSFPRYQAIDVVRRAVLACMLPGTTEVKRRT